MQLEKHDKEIITSNISTISKFIESSNEDTQNYLLFNETLFLNHNSWLEKIKSQIRQSIREQNSNINFTDINYNQEILNLLQKIAKPNDYRNNMNKNNGKMCKEDMDKIDKLMDFNDIIETTNKTCSKHKRESLIAKIHNNNTNNNSNNISNSNNINNSNNNSKEINLYSSDDNGRVTFKENKEVIDDDIIMDDIISSTQKVKLDSNGQIEKEDNSLCTIVEQPSLEEQKKSIFSYNVPSNHFEEKKVGNFILDLNNNTNSSNISNKLINKSANNNINYKPLKLSESIITPKKEENNIKLDSNNKINFNSNVSPGFTINLNSNQFSFNKNGQQNNNNSNINNNSNNIHINSKNEITFNLSSNKKNIINFSSNKKNLAQYNNNNNNTSEKEILNLYQSNQKNNFDKNNGINDTPTLNPKFQESNAKNDSNNNNFIKLLTNTIDKIASEKNNVSNNASNNNIVNINENNSINNNIKNNYVQDLVLQSSSKKIKTEKNYVKNKKEKYLNDFEEYELSDSSRHGEDDDDEEEEYDDTNSKFIPKWAMDDEYINAQLMKQRNNKNLVYKSFGNFVVELLNLNMIFETHNDRFDVRNSTADWRGDNSWEKNKVNHVNNNEGNDIFPNRELQFV